MIKHVASITKSLEFKFEFSTISLLIQDQIFNVSILEFMLNLIRLANKTLKIINNSNNIIDISYVCIHFFTQYFHKLLLNYFRGSMFKYSLTTS